MSYVRYLGKEATEQYKIAVLLGEVKEWEGSACIFVSGALEVEGVQIEECNCFPKEIWEGIYRLIEENFNNSILCLLKDRNGAAENPVCLRCGKCVGVCPMRLQPLYMYRFVKAGRVDELERLNVLDCIECGSCAFTCPGKLPLVEKFRKGKQMVREAKAK